MRLLSAISIALLATSMAVAKDAPTYRWLREIKLPAIEATTPIAVPLDSHFYQFTRDNWPDVRVQNDRGEAVAFLIRPAQEMKSRSIRRFWPAEQISATVHRETGLQVEIALRSKESVPTGIRIVTPLRDFEHQIQIERSTDGQTWERAGPPAIVFDYSRYVDARSDQIPMEAGTDRRFRITVLDPTAEQESQFLELHRRLSGTKEVARNEQTMVERRPFRIDQIEFYRDDISPQKSEPRLTLYPADHFEEATDEKKQRSIITFSMRREPITQIKIVTQAENFSRAATVEAEVENSNGKLEWRQIATGTLTRFAVGAIQRKELTLAIPDERFLQYRLLIENRDSPPLSVIGVEPSGPIYELTFLGSPDQKLVVAYGSLDSPPGHYDTAALRESLAQVGSIPAATMGNARENPHSKPDQGSWTPWNDRRILTAGIVALTGLLTWGLYRAGKRVTNSRPTGDG